MFYLTTHSTFYLWLYGIRHIVKDHSDSERGNCSHHMGYSFRLAARVLLDALSHRQDNTYHSLCYASHTALAGTRNSSNRPPLRIDRTPSIDKINATVECLHSKTWIKKCHIGKFGNQSISSDRKNYWKFILVINQCLNSLKKTTYLPNGTLLQSGTLICNLGTKMYM